MASRWLLDTSALLALRDNEAGAEHVAAIKACHALSVGRCLDCRRRPAGRGGIGTQGSGIPGDQQPHPGMACLRSERASARSR